MKLHDIGLKYKTDKSTYHDYMNIYEKYISRKNTKRFLEIGVQNGYSIRTWREWFPEDTIVEGWDIQSLPEIKNVDLRYVNQLDKREMIDNVTGIYDVILDDGGHTSEMMEFSFATLFRYSKMYIIEDLHAPWCPGKYLSDGDIPTLETLKNFGKAGWKSNHCTREELEYINNNAEILEIFVRGNDSKPLSATCVIRNKDKNVQRG